MENNEKNYQVFKAFMARYEAERGALPEPEWSQKEGSFGRAKATGVMDGTRPEDPVKRDELAAVLDRLDLLG